MLRSVLWIGRDAGFDVPEVLDSPALDVAWVRDVDEALEMPLEAFDALVLDAPNPLDAVAESRRLVARGGPPLLARLGDADPALGGALRAVGVREVWHAGDRESLAERLAVLGAAESPAPPKPEADPAPGGIVGHSRAMRAVFELARHAQESRATVLLTGDTGTGKELLAQEIHRGSARSKGAFVAINCAAFPDTLLESELFGHLRGAFTGADRDKQGLLEVADGGTLFLDEVGETSGPFQAKLLRALQEREVRPVGGTRAKRVDVRWIAATNRDLRAEVAAGSFRADLYYRLAVFPIDMPALRERPEDVAALANHFLARHGRREGKPGCTFTRDATRLLASYAWPGNVRELENEVQRVLALARPGEAIDVGLLSKRLHGVLEAVDANVEPGETLRDSLQRVEAWLIRRALERAGGGRTVTARGLGITREGLYKKMKRLGIE
ncbi:MAG: sigma 54-interacting transcriptional regulator [Myxococcales bacterium]|nr:sigma 54-interacting transcriptional regulator [Myxococcales bacterium]